MITTHNILMSELKDFGAPANKIMRMVHSGELIPLTRGIYETDISASPVCLAASIYGPSYVSFEYALAYYDLIPERVMAVTSATFEKGKHKNFTNAFGRFSYRDIPSSVFPLGIKVNKEGDYFYRIATPEKALCDQLYKAKPVGSVKQLEELLFEDMRIDTADFNALNVEDLLIFAPRYKRTNLRLLSKLLEK